MTIRPAALPADQPRSAMPAKRAAEIIGCDLSRVYKLLRGRQIEGFRDGRAVRVYADSIVAYQAKEPCGGAVIPTAKRSPRPSSAAHSEAMSVLQGLGCLGQRRPG